ncbi:MAG: sigma-54-dependent Fis family transcriptional regulator [Myxococcales bacterium]|nr:sigma-54-dependent Fis family transcriptional regulator [Myxococcales bacterium]
MPSKFANAIDIWAGNPFRIFSPDDRKTARHALLTGPISAELSRCVRCGDLTKAKTLILAMGHAQASASDAKPGQILQSAHLPASVLRELPRKRGEYVRVAAAAGRAYQALERILGGSSAMNQLRAEIWGACFGESLMHTLELEQVIRDHDVLILGETGTGKEAVAQVFLEATPGAGNGGPAPQSALNAAAIPDTLVESELFGHGKGAFTGATEARLGRLRAAAGGAFFLDEVGDLPSTTQVKLLRVMETNEIYPLGTDTPHQADVRYVAATHKDLREMVDNGEFRRDLFGRLAGITIQIPPLRDRPEDIEEIGMGFVKKYIGEREGGLDSAPLLRWLRSGEARNYHWPGNVRELQNALRNLMLGLSPGVSAARVAPSADVDIPVSIARGESTLERVEEWYVGKVLAQNQSNLTQAAQTLGVNRSTLRRRLKRQQG